MRDTRWVDAVVSASERRALLMQGGVELHDVQCAQIMLYAAAAGACDDLAQAVRRITPVWKGGALEYVRRGGSELNIFRLAHALRRRAKRAHGASASARSTSRLLRTCLYDNMLHEHCWHALLSALSEDAGALPASPVAVDTAVLLVLSFDGAPPLPPRASGRTDACSQPGPANELLAQSAIAFCEACEEGRATRTVVAQWEVACAMRARGLIAIPVGTPSRFQNTAEVLALMRPHVPPTATPYVMAHPDHAWRALRTARTIVSPNCTLAMSSSSLSEAAPLDAEDVAPTSVRVSRDDVRWDDWKASGGYYPHGGVQEWTHDRTTFLAYEVWARVMSILRGDMHA